LIFKFCQTEFTNHLMAINRIILAIVWGVLWVGVSNAAVLDIRTFGADARECSNYINNTRSINEAFLAAVSLPAARLYEPPLTEFGVCRLWDMPRFSAVVDSPLLIYIQSKHHPPATNGTTPLPPLPPHTLTHPSHKPHTLRHRATQSWYLKPIHRTVHSVSLVASIFRTRSTSPCNWTAPLLQLQILRTGP
jgi:hypothetical protein